MKVIITKYATTSGVKVMEASRCSGDPTMVKTSEMFGYYVGSEWYEAKENARFDTRSRFFRKRASLTKQLDALAGKERKALDVIEKAEL